MKNLFTRLIPIAIARFLRGRSAVSLHFSRGTILEQQIGAHYFGLKHCTVQRCITLRYRLDLDTNQQTLQCFLFKHLLVYLTAGVEDTLCH